MDFIDLVNKSLKYLNAHNPKKAKKLCLKAIKLSPDCAEAWNNLSFAEIQLNNPKAALESAQKAISLKPIYPAAWHNCGEAYLLMGKPEDSLQCNNRALTMQRNESAIWKGKAKALINLDRYEEAIACLDKVVSLEPNFPLASRIKDVSCLFNQEEKRELLYKTVEISLECFRGKLSQKKLSVKLAEFVNSNRSNFDRELIKLFDSFAMVNISAKKASIAAFCLVNRMFAEILKYEELMDSCSKTLYAATIMFKRN